MIKPNQGKFLGLAIGFDPEFLASIPEELEDDSYLDG